MTGLKKYVLIVAGGTGTRMGYDIPKQFIPIAGKPILIHTFKAFLKYSQDLIFILVLPANQIERWKKICEDHNFTTPHIIRQGGDSRFQSVKSGLDVITDEGLVAIHDGVRPCLPEEVIASSFRVAESKGSAVASVITRDSVRKRIADGSVPISRNEIAIVQTPQTFWVSKIKQAYQIAESETFTDDATVFEASGQKINLVEGSYLNVKITSPEDLLMAQGFLSGQE